MEWIQLIFLLVGIAIGVALVYYLRLKGQTQELIGLRSEQSQWKEDKVRLEKDLEFKEDELKRGKEELAELNQSLTKRV